MIVLVNERWDGNRFKHFTVETLQWPNVPFSGNTGGPNPPNAPPKIFENLQKAYGFFLLEKKKKKSGGGGEYYGRL